MSDDLVEIKARVLGAISDYSELSPEQGETWESWFHAAFDMASDKVGDLLDAELATLRAGGETQSLTHYHAGAEALADNERLRAEVAEAKAATLIMTAMCEDTDAELTAARAELAGLKAVGDEALIVQAAHALERTALALTPTYTPVGEGWTWWITHGHAQAVVSAIAPSLIARGVEKERERAVTECAAVADKHRGYANLAALEAACECLERIRAGAAP